MNTVVVGAAGYAGIEAVRYVLGHPRLRLTMATSAADEGRALSDLYPALAGATDISFTAPDTAAIAEAGDVAFLSVPHTAALELAPALLGAGMTVIDLSADFRLKDPSVYETWYETPHTHPELLSDAVYGLPEISREGLAGAKLVACPGCYPTASALAAMPALEAGLLGGARLVIDAKSGVSGAGRSPMPGVHFCATDESFAPYKVASHRHTPEIEQTLTDVAGKSVRVTFTPHLLPTIRGLLATVYVPLASPLTTEAAVELYTSRYAQEPFVHVHGVGRMPGTREVSGTNRAHIGVAVDERTSTLVAVCAIDNLGKGAAGQAIQCANIALGFVETDGLVTPTGVV